MSTSIKLQQHNRICTAVKNIETLLKDERLKYTASQLISHDFTIILNAANQLLHPSEESADEK